MLNTHKNLIVAGATEATDTEAIQDFKTDTGAEYPIVYGVSSETAKAYGVDSVPHVAVVNEKGEITAATLEDVEKDLAKEDS